MRGERGEGERSRATVTRSEGLDLDTTSLIISLSIHVVATTTQHPLMSNRVDLVQVSFHPPFISTCPFSPPPLLFLHFLAINYQLPCVHTSLYNS